MVLKVGEKVPHFTAKDTFGNLFDSQSLVGKKAVVIYFYPKDDTMICTKQACGFRDSYAVFKDQGVDVIGISTDSLESHQEFTNKHNLPFLLLTDEDKKIQKLFGVSPSFFGLLSGRITFLIDKNGVVNMVFDSFFASNHIAIALENVKTLNV